MKKELIFALFSVSIIGTVYGYGGRGPQQQETIVQRGGGATTEGRAEAHYKNAYINMYKAAANDIANLAQKEKEQKLRQIKNEVGRDRHLDVTTRQAKLDALSDLLKDNPNKFE